MGGEGDRGRCWGIGGYGECLLDALWGYFVGCLCWKVIPPNAFNISVYLFLADTEVEQSLFLPIIDL